MSQTQTKLLSSVPAISSLAEGDKITVVTASGQTALVSLSDLLATMKVGGRNLLKGTATPTNVFPLTTHLEQGQDYIVSFRYSSEVTQGVYCFYLRRSDNSGISFAGGNHSIESGEHIMRHSFKATSAIYSEAVKIILATGAPHSSFSFKEVKLERGNIPTDWSPAPEDLNWGGVIPSFSEASKASARISKKGGLQHEYIDNYADKGSLRGGTDTATPECTCASREMRGHQQLPATGILVYVDQRSELSGIPALWNTDGVSLAVICSPSLLAYRSEADIFKNCGAIFEPRWIQPLGYDNPNVAFEPRKEVAA